MENVTNTPEVSASVSLAKLQDLEKILGQRIRGQSHVIPRVVSVLQRGELGLTKSTRPRGSFMFLGPTGVGKTEITLTFTEFLFGPDRLSRFDMSEYQTQESLGVLLGARLGERGTLGMAYDKSNSGTLLFDEFCTFNIQLTPQWSGTF
jgi:ATP-dependent Clp protease ATP-binding subunit ClpA